MKLGVHLCGIRNTLMLFLILMSSFVSAQWVKKADGLIQRSELGETVVYDSKFYTFTGFSDASYTVEPTSERYDPVTNTWAYIATMPPNAAMTHQDIILIDNTVWLIGGRVGKNPGPVSSLIWIYNITTNSWSAGPVIRDPATGNPLVLAASASALLGRSLHIFGGFTPNACNNDQDKYHLTLEVDTWLANTSLPAQWKNNLKPLPQKRNHLSGLTLAGKIYAIGGQTGHDCGGGTTESPLCHVYNPANDSWSQLPSLPAGRSHAEGSTFALDGKIYLVGGQQGNNKACKLVTIFDPKANNGIGAWADAPSLILPFIYEGCSATVIDNSLIISHGSQGSSKYGLKDTYTTTITRNPIYKLGFPSECLNLSDLPGASIKAATWLYTINGTKEYTISSDATWLIVSKNATGIANPNAVDIEVTANTTGLAPGNYSATITVDGTGGGQNYSSATLCVNLTVEGEPETYTLVTASDGGGQVSKNPDKALYTNGDKVILTATPDQGEEFTGWSGSATGSTNPLTVTMSSNKTITANFVQASFSISNITAPSGRSYTAGRLLVNTTVYTDRTYQATAMPANLNNALFIKTPNADKATTSASMCSFTVNGNATIYVAYDPRATVLPAWLSSWQKLTGETIGVNDPYLNFMQLYSKNFAAGPVTLGGNRQSPANGALNNYFVIVVPAANYRVNINLNGSGFVTKSPDQLSYNSGSSVVLTATPATGQQFVGWSGDAGGIANPLTITMDADKTITATFDVTADYSLTLSANGIGTVDKSPDQVNYTGGSVVTLNATPWAGQQFTGWSGDATGTVNPLMVTMSSNKVITANFIESSFTISNIIAASGRSYIAGRLLVNTTVYTDRTYKATTVPANLNNALFIKTPNKDKSTTSASMFSFTINSDAAIYIAYDPRGTVLPAWLSSWQKLSGQTISVDDPYVSFMQLYRKDFFAGSVTLGGNLQSPANGALNNYFAIIVPAVTNNLGITMNRNGLINKNPNRFFYNGFSGIITGATSASSR